MCVLVYVIEFSFHLTIKLYRRRPFGGLIDGLLVVPIFGSSVSVGGTDVKLREALESDLMITLPRQFLKFPDENKAMPTYL